MSEDTAMQAWRSFMRAKAEMHRSLRVSLGRPPLRRGQAWVLRLVGEAGEAGVRMTDLSKSTFVTSANITRLIDQLEEAGYVARETDPADRRVYLVKLTQRGLALHQELAAAHRAWVGRLMSCLSPKEQTQLHGLLSRLAEHTAKITDGEVDPTHDEKCPDIRNGGE